MMICGLLFGLGAVANAQDGRPAGGQGARMGMTTEARVKQLDEKLKLSDDQKTKLTTLFTDQAAAQKKERESGDNNQDRTVRMEKMQKQRTELETNIANVLNDEQKKAYKAMLEEQKAQTQKRMQERQNNPG